MKTRDLVYQCIVEYMEEHQYAPSIRELCEMTGLSSTQTVYHHLINLDVIDGKINYEGGRQIKVKGYQFARKI